MRLVFIVGSVLRVDGLLLLLLRLRLRLFLAVVGHDDDGSSVVMVS